MFVVDTHFWRVVTSYDKTDLSSYNDLFWQMSFVSCHIVICAGFDKVKVLGQSQSTKNTHHINY